MFPFFLKVGELYAHFERKMEKIQHFLTIFPSVPVLYDRHRSVTRSKKIQASIVLEDRRAASTTRLAVF